MLMAGIAVERHHRHHPLARIVAAANSTKSTTKPKPKAPQVTVGTVLEKLNLSGAIDTAQYYTYLAAWNSALAEERHLPATRKVQLSDETVLLHGLAASGQMTGAPAGAVATLQRNAQCG